MHVPWAGRQLNSTAAPTTNAPTAPADQASVSPSYAWAMTLKASLVASITVKKSSVLPTTERDVLYSCNQNDIENAFQEKSPRTIRDAPSTRNITRRWRYWQGPLARDRTTAPLTATAMKITPNIGCEAAAYPRAIMKPVCALKPYVSPPCPKNWPSEKRISGRDESWDVPHSGRRHRSS